MPELEFIFNLSIKINRNRLLVYQKINFEKSIVTSLEKSQ